MGIPVEATEASTAGPATAAPEPDGDSGANAQQDRAKEPGDANASQEHQVASSTRAETPAAVRGRTVATPATGGAALAPVDNRRWDASPRGRTGARTLGDDIRARADHSWTGG